LTCGARLLGDRSRSTRRIRLAHVEVNPALDADADVRIASSRGINVATLSKEGTAMGKGTEDRAEGTWDKAKGKVKETAGEATGDGDMEREGRMDQAKGAGKRALGNVKDAAGKVKDDLGDAADNLSEGDRRDDR
jgi:uncharacterized protein YjbJ (UPF0337 family)